MNAKQELINRYVYLYQNASFILAPFIKKMSDEDRQKLKEDYIKILENCDNSKIKQEVIDSALSVEAEFNYKKFDDILYLLEDFLFTDKDMTTTKLYKMIESNKKDVDYLIMIKEKLELAKQNKISLTLNKILEKIGLFLDNQLGDKRNKRRKLKVLDEYYKLYRYINNDKIIFGGRKLNFLECGIYFPEQKIIPKRLKKDVGTKKNKFIREISSLPKYDYNNSIFTEDEKQEVYLILHDELPWNIEINCSPLDELNIQKETKCCNQNFYINESKIFIGPNSKFYQMCPNCGYIVEIPFEILTPGMIERIKHNGEIENLFDKLCILSKQENVLFHMNDRDKQKILRFINNR